MENDHYYLIVFGVAGSGKTTISKMLAKKLAVEFIEGDDFHPQASIDKMRNGMALNDLDRLPWLNIIKEKLANKIKKQKNFVLSCSALKVSYRDILREAGSIKFLFLKVSEKEVFNRLKQREGHFMSISLLHSQIQTLEIPDNEKDVITIDASKEFETILEDCLSKH